jgi:hypothetical protein
MSTPVYRFLRGYTLDPGFSTRLDTAAINVGVYRIPFEKDLKAGPVGEYIEVVDFDPASGCWYEPVDLRQDSIASQHGLTPSEGDPQFHQQFVYAVAMKTIQHFERALGRKIVWSPRNFNEVSEDKQYVAKLRIHPHAIRDTNAYYDPDKKAVLFGYFAAADQSQGANYPGGLVFTCLSPDIVAHEMTHAILDSIHHRYMEDTNLDVSAFHEGFADIVALLQRFTFSELVEHQLFASSGRLDRYTVLGELATQFGEALEGNRGALRSMIGRWNKKNEWVPLKPSPSDYASNEECHDRGAVLVATIFDAFHRIYNFQTKDLIRIATNGTGVLPEGSVSKDLVHRLAGEAAEIAGHLLHICIRALDYCPPIDISFGDYLRALITADRDIAPEDQNGYRLALIEAFRARGIFPSRVTTLSEESLCWERPDFTKKEQLAVNWIANKLKEDIRKLAETTDREELFNHSREACKKLWNLLMGKDAVFLQHSEWEKFLNKLGLTALPMSEMFGAKTKEIRFINKAKLHSAPPIEIHAVRPAFRAGREERQKEQVIVTFSQSVTVDIGDNPKEPVPMPFRGGCSLILSFGDKNEVEYLIVKDVRNHRRLLRQMKYLNGDDEDAAPTSSSLYADSKRELKMNFAHLHSHS